MSAASSPADVAVLRLPAILDVRAALSLRDEFLAVRGRDLQVDGSAVQRLGGLCLQVLLSAAKTWAADARGFGLSAPSVPLADALALLGADRLLAPSQPGADL